MARKCLISNCGSKIRPFHEIPANTRMRQLWLEKIQAYADITTIGDMSVLCGEHFTEHDYLPYTDRRKRLNKNAVPSIFKARKQPDTKRSAVRRSNQFSESNPQCLRDDKSEAFNEAIPRIEPEVDPLGSGTPVLDLLLRQENGQIEFVDVQSHSETRDQENNQQKEKIKAAQFLKQYITALERENCRLRSQLVHVDYLKHIANTLCQENKKLKQKLIQSQQRLKQHRNCV